MDQSPPTASIKVCTTKRHAHNTAKQDKAPDHGAHREESLLPGRVGAHERADGTFVI